jgi:hypothetical protein
MAPMVQLVETVLYQACSPVILSHQQQAAAVAQPAVAVAVAAAAAARLLQHAWLASVPHLPTWAAVAEAAAQVASHK